MLDVIWRPEAQRQVDSFFDYIAERNLTAAEKLKARIIQQVELCRSHPHIGRPGRVFGSRELIVHPNYIVIYRITESAVDIIRVLHAHQQYP